MRRLRMRRASARKIIPPPPQASDWARDIFPALLAAGETLRAEVIDGYCLGIDTPEAYERAQELFRTGVAYE